MTAATRHLFPGMGKYADKDECPDKRKHTPMPSSYIQWHEKARSLRKTHLQKQCPTCGFWSIWKPRAKVKP